MKTLMTAALAFSLSAGMAAAKDPVEGVWKTQPDNGQYAHITMEPCGDALCGLISNSFNEDGEFKSSNHNKKLVYDMVSEGGGKYKGKVWRPSNGKVYLGKMDLAEDGNTLDMKGCVAGGMICSKQKWTRLK